MCRNPCYECSERTPLCHSECHKYGEWRKANEERRAETTQMRHDNYLLRKDERRRSHYKYSTAKLK